MKVLQALQKLRSAFTVRLGSPGNPCLLCRLLLGEAAFESAVMHPEAVRVELAMQEGSAAEGPEIFYHQARINAMLLGHPVGGAECCWRAQPLSQRWCIQRQ